MTAAARRFCTFTIGGRLFGVDVERVQEVLASHAMTPVPLAPGVVRGLLNLRGLIVTAIDLRSRLDLPPAPPGLVPGHVVIRSGGEVVSLLVDAPGDVVEGDAAAFERPPATLAGPARDLVEGAQKLDGALLLVLDTDRALDGAPEPT